MPLSTMFFKPCPDSKFNFGVKWSSMRKPVTFCNKELTNIIT